MLQWCECWGEGWGCLGHHMPLCSCCKRTCFTRSEWVLLACGTSKGLPNCGGIMCLSRTVTLLKLLVMLRGVITGGLHRLMREWAGSGETLLNLDKHPQTRLAAPRGLFPSEGQGACSFMPFSLCCGLLSSLKCGPHFLGTEKKRAGA